MASTKINGRLVCGTEVKLIIQNTPTQATNYADADEVIIIKMSAVIEIVTAGSDVTFNFSISANSISFVPTIYKGSRVVIEAL